MPVPEIPIPSSFGYVGAFLFLVGAFLVLTGFGIIKVDKVTVARGRQTWAFGLIFSVVGVLFLLFDVWKVNGLPFVTTTPTVTPTPLYTIDFNYSDSPLNHGWETVDITDTTQLVVEPIVDEVVGNAIHLSSSVWYGIDFNIPQPAQSATVVEFVVDFNKGASIYTLVRLQDSANTQSISAGWIKFSLGQGVPRNVGTSLVDQGEWEVFIQPVSHEGKEWFLYRADLMKAIEQTFGKNGWQFLQLKEIRVRGDLVLDRISLLGAIP